MLVFRETGRDGLPVDRFAEPGTMVWDRRFRVETRTGGKMAGLTVRALGIDGIARIRAESRLRDIPLAAARVAPGVFAGDRLLAAPLVEEQPGAYSPPDFAFAFVGGFRFAASGAENRENASVAARGGTN